VLVVLHLPKLDGVFRAHRHDRQGTAEIIVVEPGRRFRSHGVDQIELVAFRIPDRRLACVVLDLEVDDGEFRVDFLVVENTKNSGDLRVICGRGARVQHQNAVGRGAVLRILGPDDDLQGIGRVAAHVPRQLDVCAVPEPFRKRLIGGRCSTRKRQHRERRQQPHAQIDPQYAAPRSHRAVSIRGRRGRNTCVTKIRPSTMITTPIHPMMYAPWPQIRNSWLTRNGPEMCPARSRKR